VLRAWDFQSRQISVSKIRVRLLGGFEAWAGERRVSSFESQKALALLVYLACNRRRAFSRDHLAGLLWPGRDRSAAHHALSQAIDDLRSELSGAGDLLQATDREIGLSPQADLWLDVEAFEEALLPGPERRPAPSRLSAAMQLYQGDLLAGYAVKDGSGFEGWMLAERARLREAALAALNRLIEGYRGLFQAILSETAREPVVPLAGRAGAYEQMRECWTRVLAGRVHLTVVAGETGVGKTRLIKSFLDAVTPQWRCAALEGRCYEMSPLLPYWPFREALRGALASGSDPFGLALESVSREVLADLAQLIPELRDLRPDLPPPAPLSGPQERRRLFTSVGLFLEGLRRSDAPLLLCLDDLHLADLDTLELLSFLVSKLEGPVWIIAACQPEEMEEVHPLNQLIRRGARDGSVTRLEVERLGTPALEEIARSLVGEPQAAELAGFLQESSTGLPLAVSELIHYLWDEGALVSEGVGGWRLARALREIHVPEDPDQLIRLRVRRLPNSTRRLASLAAICGQTFDVQLLQEAADEHATVVEIGLEILLERRIIRRLALSWAGRREEEPEACGGSARRGSFELAHDRIRGAIYGELNPLRRQAMHAQVAAALESLHGGRDGEALAFHHMAANQWEKALPHLERSIEQALAVGAVDAARRCFDQAIEGMSRLAAAARSEIAAARWRVARDALRERAAKLAL
jgi:hypothetical protein